MSEDGKCGEASPTIVMALDVASTASWNPLSSAYLNSEASMMSVSNLRRFAKPIVLSTILLSFANAQAPPTIDQALARLGLSKDRVSLYKALQDPRSEVREIAAAKLAEMRDVSAIPMIVDAMTNEPDKQARFNMAESLNYLGSPVGTRQLQSYCLDARESFYNRMHAAIDLSNTGNYECLSSISDILYSPDVGMRQSALLYVSHIPAPPPTFPPQLGISLLNIARHDSDPNLRSLAGKIILQIGDQKTKTAYRRLH